MLDKYLSHRSSKKDILSTPDYHSGKAVTIPPIQNPDAEKLAVIFEPWHGGGKFLDKFVSRLIRSGHAVQQLDFNDQILSPRAVTTLDSFRAAQNVITRRLNKKGPNYDSVHFYGASLGNVALALVAKSYRNFSTASLVAAGGNLATATWTGIRTQRLKRELVDQPYALGRVTQDGLEDLWEDLAPSNHASAFNGKRVLAVPSLNDEIIPTSTQFDFIDALSEADADISVKTSRLGHYATIAAHYWRGPTDI